MRSCSTCTQPFTPKVHTQRFCSSPCRDHKLGRKPRVKAKTAQRDYGAAHQRERRRWAVVVDRGDATCCRCGTGIIPGALWHLDHEDQDRTRYRGVAHARCNVRAGAIKGNHQRHRYTSTTPRVAR